MNEGTVDRAIRIVLGVALLSVFFFGPRSLLGLIGLVPLVTGIIGYCPLYALFGVRTCTAPIVRRVGTTVRK